MIGSLVKQGKYVGGRQLHKLIPYLENKVQLLYIRHRRLIVSMVKGLLFDLWYAEKVDVVYCSVVYFYQNCSVLFAFI